MRLEARVVERVGDIDKAEWNALVGQGSPFLEWGFLTSLEDAGCLDPSSGWYPKIVALRDEKGTLVGAAPLYIKTHSQGEFVFDWSWADLAHRSGIPYYPKAVIAVPFSPVTGVRLLVADREDKDTLQHALVQACIAIAQEFGLSSLHFNFVKEEELHAFEAEGLHLRQGIQYHWKNRGYTNFDEYLGELRAKRRANIRRERRLLKDSGVTTRVLTSDIDPELMPLIFQFYRNTVQKFYWGSQYLNLRFFELIQKRLPEHLHLVVAEHKNQVFAGTFNLTKGDRLYGRYWGCSRHIEFTHFEVCMYRAIEWSIDHGIQVFEPGAGGEHKHDRGFEATVTHSAHWFADGELSEILGKYLEHEREVIDQNLEILDAQGAYKRLKS